MTTRPHDGAIAQPGPSPLTEEPLFEGFLLGGFEGTTQRLKSGRRVDHVAATRHDEFAREDYRRLRNLGVRATRDGIRWHRIEPTPGTYDFAETRAMIRAAQDADVRVIWTLLQDGWPDHVDPFAADFPDRFGRFVARFADVLHEEGETAPAVCPVHEISTLAQAGGEEGLVNPFAHRRGSVLKTQLARAAIVACRAMRTAFARARFVHVEPLSHIVERPGRPQDREAATSRRESQWHAWDILAGRRCPDLGGEPGYLDVLGVRHSVHDQWFWPGGLGAQIAPGSRPWRRLADTLVEAHRRYGRPMFLTGDGVPGPGRAAWLAYLGHEARAARHHGVDVLGVCVSPALAGDGGVDASAANDGLWGIADDRGERAVHASLAGEVQRQMRLAASEHSPAPAADAEALLARMDTVLRSTGTAG